MKQFAQWLSTTVPSVFIQNHNSWTIPAIQSIHISGIAMAFGAVFLIDLRLLGWAGMDQTVRQTANRFGPWLTGSLWLLLATGVLLVIGEPVRELITFSFWLKMLLVAVGSAIAVVFLRAVRRDDRRLESSGTVKLLAVLTFFIWTCIIILGRLIAYDHVWGSWSPGRS